jgi:hypothetical protein
MSKNRLDESTIRRFMGLAGLKPIGESFFDRMEEQPEEEEALAPEGEPEAPPADDAALGDDPAADADAAADPETAEAAAEMAQDVADAVADALTTALGQHGVTVDSGGGEEVAPEAELGGEEELAGAEEPMPGDEELPPEEEMALETATPEDDALSKLESANVEMVDDDEVVQEVARRVAARLLRDAKKQ